MLFQQRKWAGIVLNSDVKARPFQFNNRTQCIGGVVLEIDHLQKKRYVSKCCKCKRILVKQNHDLTECLHVGVMVLEIVGWEMLRKENCCIEKFFLEVMLGYSFGKSCLGIFFRKEICCVEVFFKVC